MLAVALPFAPARPQGALAENEVFVGIVVDGEDLGAVFARRQDDVYLLPLAETMETMGARADVSGSRPRIATPIGARTLPAEAIETIDDVAYLRSDFLTEALATPARFDEDLFALVVDLPWRPGDQILDVETEVAEAPPEPDPDASPDPISLTRIRGELGAGYNGTDEAIEAARGDLRVAGPAFGGLWQVRLLQDFDEMGGFEPPTVQDYVWIRPIEERVWTQIGNQRLAVGPLVGGAEVTGAQLAVSTRPQSFSASVSSPGALLSGFGSGTRTFSGEGPPGGRAELWARGRRIASAPIGIDGRYSIEDAPLFGAQTEVEVRIYRRARDLSPLETRPITITRAGAFQPAGTYSVLAGGGAEGNPLDPDETRKGALGFVRAQAAPVSFLTVGASALGFDDGDYVTGVDGSVELGPFASGFASVATDAEGVGAYEVGLLAAAQMRDEMGQLYLDASTFEVRDGFNDRFDDDEEDEDLPGPFDDDPFALLSAEVLDRRAAVGWRRFGLFDVGVEARRTEMGEYVLPFGYWQVRRELSLSARPEITGDYRFEARWADSGLDARALRVDDASGLRARQETWFENVGEGSVYGDATLDDDGRWRALAGLSAERIGDAPVDWRLEAGADDGEPIALAALGRALVPGVRGYAETSYYDGALNGFVGLTLDLSLSQGRLGPGSKAPLDARSGAVEAVLVGPDGAPLSLGPEERPVVYIDDRGIEPRSNEGEDGSVWRADLVPTGLRRVEIAEGDLPIELTPERRIWHVEVSPAAVTTLRVPIEVLLGASGVVTGPNGAPLARARVTAVAPGGEETLSTRANAFGQFRLDGLRPGRWLVSAGGEPTEVELTDAFAFGVEVRAPTTVFEEPATASDGSTG